MTPVAARLLRLEGADALYQTSAFFHRLVDTVAAEERVGGDGVTMLGQVLVRLFQHHDAVLEEAIQRVMRAPLPKPGAGPTFTYAPGPPQLRQVPRADRVGNPRRPAGHRVFLLRIHQAVHGGPTMREKGRCSRCQRKFTLLQGKFVPEHTDKKLKGDRRCPGSLKHKVVGDPRQGTLP